MEKECGTGTVLIRELVEYMFYPIVFHKSGRVLLEEFG